MYTNPLVINWHLTEVCNYSCQYCYAKWNKASQPRELIHNSAQTLNMLNELYWFFISNTAFKNMSYDSIRLNLAGGEPLLYPEKFISIVKQAKNIGFEVSLISNASQLNGEVLEQLAPHLSWLGISIDSNSPTTNLKIGRIDKHGRLLDVGQLTADIQSARKNNPKMRVKLNTVVNSLNHQENLSEIISEFSPDKWKILKMLPILDQSLSISNAQFDSFINRHKEHQKIIFSEDNTDMSESYLMIDPLGRFFQNGKTTGYFYSNKILDAGVESAFSEMTFKSKRFNSRYTKSGKGEVA